MSSKPRADHVGETRTAYLKNARRVIMAGEVCGICGRPVDKSLKYPDPMAPSVDHIIPISRGGHPSDIDNLQLTHWCCNHAKSDRLTAAPPRPWQAGPSVSNRNLPQHVDWGNYRGDTTPGSPDGALPCPYCGKKHEVDGNFSGRKPADKKLNKDVRYEW